MRTALNQESTLGSPTVGTWRPQVGVGAPLEPGQVLGVIVRAGDRLEVRAPNAAGGVAAQVTPAGQWVAYGDALVVCGEATGIVGATAGPAVTGPSDIPEGVVVLRAETDGTIYLRPDPQTPPFVVQGATVTALATVALVEVMKTFTPVRAAIAGEVVRVCVDDGASVEAGDALFWMKGG